MLISRQIKLILLKAIKESGQNRKVKNNPVIIWIDKQIPERDPIFHHRLILEGVGKLINELFNNLINGLLI